MRKPCYNKNKLITIKKLPGYSFAFLLVAQSLIRGFVVSNRPVMISIKIREAIKIRIGFLYFVKKFNINIQPTVTNWFRSKLNNRKFFFFKVTFMYPNPFRWETFPTSHLLPISLL